LLAYLPLRKISIVFLQKNIHLKKIVLSVLLASVFNALQAQHYYKDIITNNQILAEMKLYKEQKINKIIIKSFEEDGSESEGFFCEKKISKNYKKSSLFTRSDFNFASEMIANYNEDGKLLNTYDSSSFSITEINYSYSDKNLLQQVFSSIRAKHDDYENEITEEHYYFYENNLPIRLYKIKNYTDTTIVLFELDENGNVGIEKDTKTGAKYYYYYDKKNRLTDIVPETQYTKNLKPDYIFEYNNANQLTQMTTVEEGSSTYLVWKYSYENGLRTREKCFVQNKKLLGKIEYEYK
jgi:hypothetical protein